MTASYAEEPSSWQELPDVTYYFQARTCRLLKQPNMYKGQPNVKIQLRFVKIYSANSHDFL